MGEISIKEQGKPLSKNGRRYKVNQLPIILRCYILALGRVPTQTEVRSDPKMPSLDTFFNVYPDWETAIRAARFEMHWCSQEMREKLLKKLMEWLKETPTCDPIPMPFYNEWEVQVDDETVRITGANRLIAYVKARMKYPDAKRIRVIKQLKFRFIQ